MRTARASDPGVAATGPARTREQYVHDPSTLFRTTPTSVLLLPPRRADPVVLRGTAIAIWQAYGHPATVTDAAARVADRYQPAARTTIAGDVRRLTDELVALGALVPAS